ncbi:glycoside hydrolase family 15 protein [Noviherbaspirillum agri]
MNAMHAQPDRPIADYAIIGDTRTAALIASNGSLDWCCFPHFDSPAVFCKLLDVEKGGEFRIEPIGDYTSARAYLDRTNVLCTTFSCTGGQCRLTDFMTIAAEEAPDKRDANSKLVRRIEGVTGECAIEVVFRPTFDFARDAARIELIGNHAIASGAGTTLVLHSTVPLQYDRAGTVHGRFVIKAGQHVDFCLVNNPQDDSIGNQYPQFDYMLEQTISFWHAWSSRCTYEGPYRDLVLRSALVLKLLTFSPNGAVVAAPTTSLPEEIGGVRNWDYRYTWIRDSSLILDALMSIGFHEEALHFFDWIESLGLKRKGHLQIMYGIDGRTDLHEEILPDLAGYRQSRPVRIGNAAAQQKQLDIYGELLEAVAVCYQSMRMTPPDSETWAIYRYVANQAVEHWQEPDEGIWEVRGAQLHFLYSKLMCWVAVDRAILLADKYHLPADLERWRQTREDIRSAILARGYDEELGAFTQAFGVKALDASALTIPLVGFLPASDARVQSTIRQIQAQLSANGLVYRYLNEDGLPGGEATFALCSFWLVDNLVMVGQVNEARKLFERIASYSNDLGLFAEEIEPVSRELLGNYPQGFTHLALIRSAVRLANAEAAKDR